MSADAANDGAYVRNVTDTVKSLWHGMSVTLSHLFRKPVTVQYPDATEVPVSWTLPARYRGLLEVDMDVCTACLACERACPIECIAIEIEKDAANPRQRVMVRFDIDAAKCMYCGLCVEPCPTGAIQHTREFEAASQHLHNLVLRFVDPAKPAPPYKPPKGAEAYPRKVLGEVLRPMLKRWDAPAPVLARAAVPPPIQIVKTGETESDGEGGA
ncbi:MAG: NuoI/complex I 23 kDa subunit family protein [Myxococcales bacterium]